MPPKGTKYNKRSIKKTISNNENAPTDSIMRKLLGTPPDSTQYHDPHHHFFIMHPHYDNTPHQSVLHVSPRPGHKLFISFNWLAALAGGWLAELLATVWLAVWLAGRSNHLPITFPHLFESIFIDHFPYWLTWVHFDAQSGGQPASQPASQPPHTSVPNQKRLVNQKPH